jgi:uncharacterized membrane protein YhdT
MEFACMLSGYQEEVGQMLEVACLYTTLGLVLGSWLILSFIFTELTTGPSQTAEFFPVVQPIGAGYRN